MTQTQGWKLVAAAAVALGLAFSPMAAMAVELSFTQQGGFTIGTATSGGPGNLGGVEFFGPTGFVAPGGATYGQIGWGCGNASSTAPAGQCSGPNNSIAPQSPVNGTLAGHTDFPVKFRSALDLDVFSTATGGGTLTVGDPNFTPISSLQHYNRTISQSSAALSQVTIDSLLTLDTFPPGGGSDSDADAVVLHFNETLNAQSPCPAGGPNPCADIFTFASSTFQPVLFTVGGVQYQAEFNLSLPPTTFDERTLTTVPNGATPCLDVTTNVCTNENAISEAIIGIRISLAPVTVPAPASLLLLGFGLSGLGAAGWLRRK